MPSRNVLEFGDAFRGSINLAVSSANPLEPKGDDQIEIACGTDGTVR